MVGNQSKSILPSGKTGSSDKRKEEVGLGQSDVGSSLSEIQCPLLYGKLQNSPDAVQIKSSEESEALNMVGAQ